MRIWDFDGVIFNSQGDYSDDFLIWNAHNKGLVAALPELCLMNMGNCDSDRLITHRPKSQLDMIKEILSYNNLYFDEIIFGEDLMVNKKGRKYPTQNWKSDYINQWSECSIITTDINLQVDKDHHVFLRSVWTPDLRGVFKP